ncbi:hypothetical protein Rsub_01184 [Raphidocelis subcapitata]|uniref:Carbohydrate kinase PfkB domain-containing protein n=1 Tax=Raphidocelis subcapitata TaxID=307507 RepID=A0A2V0NLZ4_9CHLO|nr:hypothetical protein Rsub_01184 [Raphidocelis subcapitata]|eukprot:GBF88471.1 hypothetical protein Rsub_01184 [Raphidocelis subcapitata]
MAPEEMAAPTIAAALDGAALAYFDGRLTEAALRLARAARAAGVPVLVEGERLRPGLDELLAEADYVEWTGEACLADAVLEVARRLPRARVVVTTRGTRGSVLLRRAAEGEQPVSDAPTSLEEVMGRLEQQLAASDAAAAASAPVDCVSASGVALRRGGVAGSGGALQLTFSGGRDAAAAARRAGAAAAKEAARNADTGNAAGYAAGQGAASSTAVEEPPLLAEVLLASAAALAKDYVADTTGAGDSFIGSLIYGLTTGLPLPRALQLAAVVAACKCTALGARPGLPRRGQLSADLLGVKGRGL